MYQKVYLDQNLKGMNVPPKISTCEENIFFKEILNSHIQNSALNVEIYFNVSLILQAKLLF